MSDELRDSLGRAASKPLRESLERAALRRRDRRDQVEALRMVWQGPWNKLVRYKVGDVVSHRGSSWRAIAASIDSEPPSTKWELVAKKGDKGDPGRAGIGITGPPGPPGPGGTPATTVTDETTFGLAPAVGSDLEYARQDHTHGSPPAPTGSTPASTVTDETTFGIAPVVGIGTDYARDDHTHGSPDDPVPPHAAMADVHHAQDHDHDGSPTQKLAQANTHESPDTDAGPTSLHHTLGTSATQAAAGNHTHTDPTPAGVITAFLDTAAPTGWQILDGSAISRAANPVLFAMWGTTYGPGDGSTTFNVPNTRGYMLVGKDLAGPASTLGAKFGSQNHTHIAPLHSHTAGTLEADSAGSHAHATDGDHAHADGGGHTHASAGSHNHATHNVVQRTATGANTLGGDGTHDTQGGHTHDTIAAHSHGSTGDHDHGDAGTHTHTISGATEQEGNGSTDGDDPPSFVIHWIVKLG